MASTLTPTVAMSTLMPELSGHLPGCPTAVITSSIRTVAADLCQRAKVLAVEAVPIAVTIGAYEYAVSTGVTYCESTDIIAAHLILADGSKIPLRWATFSAVQRARRSWPEADDGQPVFVTARDRQTIQLAPVPDTDATLYLTVNARPTSDADVLPEWLHDEFNRELFHGVLHQLMMMPSRSWTNEKLAMYHGKHWAHRLAAARYRASTEYNVGTLSVEMRPFA